jgi:ATP adenylyltransferase
MNVIWAPWRMAYIRSSRKPTGCIFCMKSRERRDASNLLLHRGRHGFVIMNLFPYNSGHVMVAPYRHVKSLEALSADGALELLRLMNLSLRALRTEIRPEGFNIGINVGRVSGAGIADHVHLHIVPRWNGDTNFMPLFAETRVIPEHLQQTYRKLRARFRLLAQESPRQQGFADLDGIKPDMRPGRQQTRRVPAGRPAHRSHKGKPRR